MSILLRQNAAQDNKTTELFCASVAQGSYNVCVFFSADEDISGWGVIMRHAYFNFQPKIVYQQLGFCPSLQ